MAKNINVLLSLKDQFTKPLQNATKSTKAMDKALKNANRGVQKFGNATKAAFKKTAKYAAIGFGALTAAATIFTKQSIDAAKDQLRVEKLLETNMKRTTNASMEQIQAIKNEASALQGLGVVGDEVALAGASQLAVYGLRSDQIKKLMPNLNDMIAKEKGLNGTQEDSIAMADVIGKALAGKTKGLLKYGVELTKAEEKIYKTMSKEERMNLISKKLTASIGGVNKALRETDEGKITAAKNAWGDMKEELGKKLLPYLGKIAGWFETKIPDIQNFVLGTADKIEQMIMKAEPYLIQLRDLFGSLWEKASPALKEFGGMLLDGAGKAIGIAKAIVENWDRISPVVYTLVGAMALYKGVMFAQFVLTTAVAGAMKAKITWDNLQLLMTGKLTLAQFKLNTAMSLNPIGIVIGLIAGAVAIGWALYKNWDLVKAKTLELWNALDNNPIGRVIKWLIKFGNPIGATINLFLWLKDAILGNWEMIKNKFIPILEAISNPIETAKKAIGGLIDKFKIWNNTEPKDKTLNITENATKKTNVISETKEKVVKDEKINKFENVFTKNNVANTIKEKVVKDEKSDPEPVKSSPKPPRHALGTTYFKGGETGINEGGRTETAILPAGTKVMSHEQSKDISRKENKKIEVHVHIGGNFIGEREHMEKYAEYTGNKVLAALGNM